MELHTLLLLVSSCILVVAQFDDSDIGPQPPRLAIPGAIPLPPGGRPPFRRQRIQLPSGSKPAPLPQQNVAVVRNRRPGPVRPLAPFPPEPSFSNNVISPSSTPSSLPPPSPTPALSLAQAFPVSLDPVSSTASPPRFPAAVQESPEDDNYDLDDDLILPQNAPLPPSPQPVFTPARPQNLPPTLFRPTRPAFKATAAPPEEINFTARQQSRPTRPPTPSSTPRSFPVDDDIPARAPARPAYRPSQAPPTQQAIRQQQTPESYTRPNGRPKKPVSQVIHRYREDNPDGSITWGFENDDGTFKEETIGVDCTVKGKYGYIDPDGQRREYAYSSGIPCDKDKKNQEGGDGFIDYQDNKYILPNGDTLNLDSVVKNRARRPVQNYRI